MFKRTSVALLVLVLGFSISVAATQTPIKDEVWNELPKSEKFVINTEDYEGYTNLAIAGSLVNEHSLDVMGFNKSETEDVFNLLNETFGDKKVFLIYVQAVQTAYFWPNEFSFVQASSQWNLGYEDFMKISDTFSGELKEGTFVYGYLAVPSGVDLTNQLIIWYNNVAIDY